MLPQGMVDSTARFTGIEVREVAYWLMKSEPDVYSIDDLERDGREMWDSIRNYQARNMMRDDMRIGDEVLFYHSNCKPPAVAGISRVCSEPYPDPTQFDPKSKYFDPKSTPEAPRWVVVDVQAVAPMAEFVSLPQLKETPSLDTMGVVQRGNRLSIQPVTAAEWKIVTALGRRRRKSS